MSEPGTVRSSGRAAASCAGRRRTAPETTLLVHRPRYDDWSLPKGKAEPGESDEDAAVREVEEETGVRCRLGPELSSTSYVDRRGRPKIVRYWLMEPVEDAGEPGTFRPNDEIDDLRWCSAGDAGKILTHDHDRRLILEAEALR